MINCSRCGNAFPENDLLTRKAYRTKDGRSFCPPCTAFLIAQQKAANPDKSGQAGQVQKVQAKQSQVKPVSTAQSQTNRPQPVQGKPIQKQSSVQATAGMRKITRQAEAATPAYVGEDEETDSTEPEVNSPRAAFAKRKAASKPQMTQEAKELIAAKKKKNLLIVLGMVATILVLVGIFVSMQVATAKEEKESTKLADLRDKAKGASSKTEQVSESSDTKAMDESLKTFKESVQVFEDYANELNKLDKNSALIESLQEKIKTLEVQINKRKGIVAREEALQKRVEAMESKVANPDTVEAAFKEFDEIRKESKELQIDLTKQLEDLENKGREPFAAKLLESAKKLKEAQPIDYDAARNKFIEAFKNIKGLELYLRQENEIAENQLPKATEDEQKKELTAKIQSLKERIEKVVKDRDDTVAQIKELGQAKFAADNPQGEAMNMLDPKYAKLWKKSGEFTVVNNADGSITINVGKLKIIDKTTIATAIYYFGDEYMWEDVIIDIEFVINAGTGFTIMGRYYEDASVFGPPWGYSVDILPQDKESLGMPFARNLTAEGEDLKIRADDLDPENKANNRKLTSKKKPFSKMGGIGLNISSESTVIIKKFVVKVVK